MKLHSIFLIALLIITTSCKYFKEPSLLIEISADQLALEYQNNSPEADSKFKGQTLIVSGTISHYFQLNGIIGVYLKRNELASEWWVMCFVDASSHPDAYSRLKRGKRGNFTGIGDYKKEEFHISLNDCKFEYE